MLLYSSSPSVRPGSCRPLERRPTVSRQRNTRMTTTSCALIISQGPARRMIAKLGGGGDVPDRAWTTTVCLSRASDRRRLPTAPREGAHDADTGHSKFGWVRRRCCCPICAPSPTPVALPISVRRFYARSVAARGGLLRQAAFFVQALPHIRADLGGFFRRCGDADFAKGRKLSDVIDVRNYLTSL